MTSNLYFIVIFYIWTSLGSWQLYFLHVTFVYVLFYFYFFYIPKSFLWNCNWHLSLQKYINDIIGWTIVTWLAGLLSFSITYMLHIMSVWFCWYVITLNLVYSISLLCRKKSLHLYFCKFCQNEAFQAIKWCGPGGQKWCWEAIKKIRLLCIIYYKNPFIHVFETWLCLHDVEK